MNMPEPDMQLILALILEKSWITFNFINYISCEISANKMPINK